MNLDDVLKAALDGDEDAFRIVFRDLHPRLVRYLRAFVGPDAEDVVAETWSQIARDHRSFSGDYDKFRGWASVIARNRAIDLLRRRGRRPEDLVPAEEMVDLAGNDRVTAAAFDRITTDDAIAVIATLPQPMAQAVMLRVIIGLDAKEAGRVLGKSPGAVRTAAYRGLRELAGRLENVSGAVEGERRRECSVERRTLEDSA
ncbi:RNA polymerase sigma factor [Actinomadura sp. HBU206391]|uniref:RNA polymerase sigma factor n=1 Tax=Actinomadura sp. HBU206391 TaxID=2731692 RepID=UPI00164FF91C|nr:RNA polymerase sigma factor [Actinomadura sp. HBU206391]MBC6462626.1 RNA polymerase sigma factor [Actinomadura sp. HBU206391]